MSMPKAAGWTLEELHRLPDDGNKYELVRGRLFVTPAPSQQHEIIAALLARLLDPYVAQLGLGFVFRPRAVISFDGSEAEPDLMVRSGELGESERWEDAPTPCLVVEIVSPTTRRRDFLDKRTFYRDAGIPEYWIVDSRTRSVRVARPGAEDISAMGTLTWAPVPAVPALTIDLDAVFAGLSRYPEADASG